MNEVDPQYTPHPLDEKEWKALERKFLKFPFDLALAINRICGDMCGAPVDYGVDCTRETCEFHKRTRESLIELRVRVEQTGHVGIGDVADGDLCGKCAFGSMCTTSPGTREEPPDYGLWCEACQSLIEDCECRGKFFLRKEGEDDPRDADPGDTEPEEL